MRKRFVTTIITVILSVACVFGFTACDDEVIAGQTPAGEQVTEDEWKAAFDATTNAKNYTIEVKEVIIFENTSNDGRTYHYEDIRRYADSESFYIKEADHEVSEEYGYEWIGNIEHYYTVKENIMWCCRGESSKNIKGDELEDIEEKWDADRVEYPDAEAAKEVLLRSIGLIDDWSDYYDSYSEFTYSDGKYSTTLYDGEVIIELSFKNGHILGYSYIHSDSKVTYVFKNFGTTKVPAPKGALNAIKAAEQGE